LSQLNPYAVVAQVAAPDGFDTSTPYFLRADVDTVAGTVELSISRTEDGAAEWSQTVVIKPADIGAEVWPLYAIEGAVIPGPAFARPHPAQPPPSPYGTALAASPAQAQPADLSLLVWENSFTPPPYPFGRPGILNTGVSPSAIIRRGHRPAPAGMRSSFTS
jgi:hypothetical protein